MKKTNKTNMMKKIAIAILAVLLMSTFFAGCGIDVTLTEEENEMVKDVITETLHEQMEKTEEFFEETWETPVATEMPVATETPKTEEKEFVRYFYNDTIDGRWTPDAISVAAKEVYFENGYLVARCYIVNGYSTMATNVSIPCLKITGENDVVIAEANFEAQDLTMAPLSYVEHIFTFAPDTILNENVDMSTLGVYSQFRATH